MGRHIRTNDIVVFLDDINRVPYLVHVVNYNGNQPYNLTIGLEDCPEIEQDKYVEYHEVERLTGSELKEAWKVIRLSVLIAMG